MYIPPTEFVQTISLKECFTKDRNDLSGGLHPLADPSIAFGAQAFRGMPFLCGEPGRANVILLDDQLVEVDLGGLQASYLLFVHAVEDRITDYLPGFADQDIDGNELGQHVSDYQLTYEDGATVTIPIHRRFAIQQSFKVLNQKLVVKCQRMVIIGLNSFI